MGLYLLVGAVQLGSIFTKKVKGTIAYFLGLFLIVSNYKFFGVLAQSYAVYEFFKSIFFRVLSLLESVPIIGPYISKFTQGNVSVRKKTDAENQV